MPALRNGRRKLFPIRLVGVDRLEKWKCLATDHDAIEAAFADLRATA